MFIHSNKKGVPQVQFVDPVEAHHCFQDLYSPMADHYPKRLQHDFSFTKTFFNLIIALKNSPDDYYYLEQSRHPLKYKIK